MSTSPSRPGSVAKLFDNIDKMNDTKNKIVKSKGPCIGEPHEHWCVQQEMPRAACNAIKGASFILVAGGDGIEEGAKGNLHVVVGRLARGDAHFDIPDLKMPGRGYDAFNSALVCANRKDGLVPRMKVIVDDQCTPYDTTRKILNALHGPGKKGSNREFVFVTSSDARGDDVIEHVKGMIGEEDWRKLVTHIIRLPATVQSPVKNDAPLPFDTDYMDDDQIEVVLSILADHACPPCTPQYDTPCRNGPSCRFNKAGKCWFNHGKSNGA